jgi:hypothetical protein
MSVISVLEINNGRGGEGTVTRDKSWRTYTRVFRVICNNNADDAIVVSNGVESAYGIWPGSPYPTDFGAWCTKLNARPEGKSKLVWLATASYTSEWQPQQNPLSDPAIIEWSATPYQRPYTFDKNGHALLNSAGDTYYQPIMGDDSRWEVRVQKNLGLVPQYLLGYKDAINSDSFQIDGVSVSQYQAKVSAINIGKVQTRNNISFRVLSYTMQLDTTSVGANGQPTGWVKQVVDEGMNQILGGVLCPCCDDSWAPVRVPVLLNGSGVQLSNPTPSSVKFNSYHIYPELAFNGNLPMS